MRRKFLTAFLLFVIPSISLASIRHDAAEFLGLGYGEFDRLMILIGVPFLLFFIPFIIWIINIFRIGRGNKTPHEKYRLIRFGGIWMFTILSPFPWIFAMIVHAILKPRWIKQQNEIDRLRLVNAKGKPYRLMSEEEEDEAFLRGELELEVVKSDRYDVWVDEDTEEFFVEKTLNWHPWKGHKIGKYKGYKACPECGKKSYSPWIRKSYVQTLKGGKLNPIRKRYFTRTKRCESCKHAVQKKFWYYVLRYPFASSSTYSNEERNKSRSISDYMGKNIFSSRSSGSKSSSSSSSKSSSSSSSWGRGKSGSGGSTGGW